MICSKKILFPYRALTVKVQYPYLEAYLDALDSRSLTLYSHRLFTSSLHIDRSRIAPGKGLVSNIYRLLTVKSRGETVAMQAQRSLFLHHSKPLHI